jgi:hypothetical protein
LQKTSIIQIAGWIDATAKPENVDRTWTIGTTIPEIQFKCDAFTRQKIWFVRPNGDDTQTINEVRRYISR